MTNKRILFIKLEENVNFNKYKAISFEKSSNSIAIKSKQNMKQYTKRVLMVLWMVLPHYFPH